jgi:phosphomethylpyrimidine synthase
MPDDLSAPIPVTVTTGAITGSRKCHSAPDGFPDLRVPFREIPLDPSAREAPVRVYDTSGPFTDPAARSIVTAGSVKGPDVS